MQRGSSSAHFIRNPIHVHRYVIDVRSDMGSINISSCSSRISLCNDWLKGKMVVASRRFFFVWETRDETFECIFKEWSGRKKKGKDRKKNLNLLLSSFVRVHAQVFRDLRVQSGKKNEWKNEGKLKSYLSSWMEEHFITQFICGVEINIHFCCCSY